jgi:ergothioneine biosynthesis protein EgtB
MQIVHDQPAAHRDAGARRGSAQGLARRFAGVRARTLALAAPISPEDAMLQSMAEASPAKWHLAHSTWFFETFVLGELPGYRPVDAAWNRLFNSYYIGAGPMHARAERGLLSRPTHAQVLGYRERVDAAMHDAFACERIDPVLCGRVELGLQHEQQHQELLLTDIKHAYSCNPLLPAYRDDLPHGVRGAGDAGWQRFDEAIVEIGAPRWPDAATFAFDLESPPHRVLVHGFELAARPVTCGEYRDFIRDGGYRHPGLWLSDAWNRLQREGWARPLYWLDDAREFTLAGVRAIDPDAPVVHLSYYEADAFARWAGARLPTEFEWERAARDVPVAGNFADAGRLHPQGGPSTGLRQLFGDVWEWTASAFSPYPGFRPLAGTLGEYNGKFMCSQSVLRGGSCASPRDHLRASYRNFFPPDARWQFSGLRLARDCA